MARGLRRPVRIMDLPHLPVHEGGKMDKGEVHHFWRSLEQWGEELAVAQNSCCTSVFAGFGTGSLTDFGNDTTEISCFAPETSQNDFLYPTNTGPNILPAGNWMISGLAYITWDDPISAVDEAQCWWFPGVGSSSGVFGQVYGHSGEIPVGVELTVVNFNGVLNITDTWSPVIQVSGNFASTRTADVIVYLHALGSCACATSSTVAGG